MSQGVFRGIVASALLLLGSPVVAQSLAPAPASELPRVLPVWSTSSGRVEAVLLVDQPTPAVNLFSNSVLSELFSPQPSLGVRAEAALGRSTTLSADLGLGASSLGLLCEGNIGIAAALGRLAEHCLLARLDHDQATPEGWQQSFGLSGRWQSGDGEFDLSFGLSWLDADVVPEPMPGSLAALIPFGQLGGPAPLAAPAWQLHQREFSLQGSRWLGRQSWLRVEGRHGQSRLGGVESLFGGPSEWNSSSLSLSGGYRTFSGTITGKLIELEQPQSQWADVDISLSWQTPWHGKLSVGAKNLLGGPDRDEWPAAVLPGLSESEARTPYVRYHQDL